MPTEILRSEHNVIRDALDALERLGDDAARHRGLDLPAAREMLEFLNNYVDGYHQQGKEEAKLFPLLERKGLTPQTGPTAACRQEHEQSRSFLLRMREAVAASEEAGDAFASAARGYVALVRQHLQAESDNVFPVVEASLTPQEREALLAAFQALDREEFPAETRERFRALAHGLAQRFALLPPRGARFLSTHEE